MARIPPTDDVCSAFQNPGRESASLVYHGVESAHAATARIQEALQGLAAVGVVINKFTHDSVVNEWWTTSQFVKHIRVVTTYKDVRVLGLILNLGTEQGFFTEPSTMDVKGFTRLCYYLKSKAGQEAIQGIHAKIKLLKKAGRGGGIAAVALAKVFEIMNQEARQEKKRIREKYEEKLASLRQKIRRMEEEADQEIEAIKSRYRPACWFEELSTAELQTECYKLYEAELKQKGLVPVPEGPEGYEIAESMFGAAVRASHVENFLALPGNTGLLRQYISRKNSLP